MNTKGVGGTSASPNCEVCHRTHSLKTCSRCHAAFYCCRDHQISHWKKHKTSCKDFRRDQERAVAASGLSTNVGAISSPEAANSASPGAYSPPNSGNSYPEEINTASKAIAPELSYSKWNVNNVTVQDQTSNSASESSEQNDLQIDNDLLELTAKYLLPGNYEENNPIGQIPLDYDLTTVTEHIFNENSCTTLELPVAMPLQNAELASGMAFDDVCRNIVHDLNVHGICVMDKFFGDQAGELVLGEVRTLLQRGMFQKGQLVNSSIWKSTEGIRGDIISWVSGIEPGCEYIGSLIRKLDDVMNKCCRMEDNGILSRYKISKRTKAMVACYPGNGTHYKKHIDNPDGDGRCITCIYYLNKNWDVQKHGGLLRMFPTTHEDEIANIEPIFDRMLFFWSDRRNPHEVLPSYAVRFAITVWYFDSDERKLALIRSNLEQKQ